MRVFISMAIFSIIISGFLIGYEGTYGDWHEGPVSHLLTQKEMSEFKKITSDDAARDFIALFWARRDPTPETARNEFKEAFDKRVREADNKFSNSVNPGSITEMGKVYILMGEPDYYNRQEKSGRAQNRPVHYVLEEWGYKKESLPDCIGAQKLLFDFTRVEKAREFTMKSAINLGYLEKAKE